MIHFFRRIRQGLLSQNRLSKYMPYAIGEIVLVVIGIIIALQLNNLNQARKDRYYEVKMLTELKTSLEHDIDHFKTCLVRLRVIDSAVTDFISLAYNGYEKTDSMLLNPFNEKRWWHLRTGVDYRVNYGPYEAIKSSGMDKISNDSLRNILVTFYDFELSSFMELTKWYNRGFDEFLERQNAFLEVSQIRENNGELTIVKDIPWDLYMRPECIELLNDIGKSTGWLTGRLTSFIPKMEDIVEILNSEITQ